MRQNRFWFAGLSLIILFLSGLLIAQTSNWAQQDLVTTPADLPGKSALLQQPSTILDADLIRVGISDDGMTELEYPQATIAVTGPFRITGKSSGNLILSGPGNSNIRVTRSSSGFFLEPTGGTRIGPFSETLEVKPTGAESLLKVTSVTRKGIIPAYRGIFEILPGYSGPSKFTVVNVLPLQDYLKAVVPNELPFSYGYEAVKAQAVAARNYAIRPREKAWPQFDICDSQYCQAYYGANTEHPQTNRAIQETQGLVALHREEPILALYSSAHGGYAENYENAFSDPKTNLFPGTPIEYLRGGPDIGNSMDLTKEREARAFYTSRPANSFDILSPNYRWQKQWRRQELETIINQNLAVVSQESLTRPFVKPAFPKGGSIGRLKALEVTERGVSGKAMRLKIIGTHGTWTLEKEFVIRKVLKHNGRFLPSANVVFDAIRDPSGNLLVMKAFGGGFGHGVGMSQLGASYLSKRGKSFIDILQHYYKGVSIGTVPITTQASQGMKTDFFAKAPQGILFIKSTDSRPVRVAVNDRLIEAIPGKEGEYSLDVGSLLKPDHLNTLQLYPTENASTVAKAWIELYLPLSSSRREMKISKS